MERQRCEMDGAPQDKARCSGENLLSLILLFSENHFFFFQTAVAAHQQAQCTNNDMGHNWSICLNAFTPSPSFSCQFRLMFQG